MNADVAELDVAALRQRLSEAEETLRAIRDGEVDALVVRGDEREQVFALAEGESYRAFMEAMDLGAAALDHDGGLLYANAALASLLGRSSDELHAMGLEAAVGARAMRDIQDLIRRTRSGRQSAQVSLSVGGARREIQVTAAPVDLSFSRGHAITFSDITERLEAAAAEESNRIGRAIMASANEAVVVCDAQGVVTHANPAVLQLLPRDPAGERFDDAFKLVLAAGGGALQADDVIAIALSGSTVRGIEASIVGPSGSRDLVISAAPLRHAGEGPSGCIITLLDLTDRKALEKRQALLMRELDHRMKNMLALVQSISVRTLAGAADLRDFGQKFAQRLAALAATQNLLAERSWEGLGLDEIIAAELAPYVAPRSDRVALNGLSFRIDRDAAVALGMIFHELVTNAVKYGALANEAGRIEVEGKARDGGGLEICWTEVGGPPVSPPARRGFGQTLIARGLGSSGGGAEVTFRPEGVSCSITLAPTSIVAG